MTLSQELDRAGITRGQLAEKLGVNRKTVTRMGEKVSEEVLKILSEFSGEDLEFHSRGWKIKDEKLHWQGMIFGHGSEYDYEFSASKISHIRRELKVRDNDVTALMDWLGGVGFPREFVQDVKDNRVCPNVVDMRKPHIEGGRPIPIRVFPFGERG